MKVYTAWNEPNKPQQPVANDPEPAAKYWRLMRNRCAQNGGSCTALAGDLLDDNFKGRGGLLLGTYLKRYKDAMLRRAYSWAFHPYVTANRHTPYDSKWKAFLKGTKCSTCSQYKEPVVWVTEVGGIVSFKAQSTGLRKTYTTANAQRSIDHIMDLARSEPRVKRLFYYHWLGDETFDSGLISFRDGPEGDSAGIGLKVRRGMYCQVWLRTRPGVACP